MSRFLLVALVLLCVPQVAFAQQADFGRFRVGMSVAEVRAAATDLHWREQAFGEDLVVLTADRPIPIGRIGFQPQLEFRDGGLAKIEFQAGGPIVSANECDRMLAETVVALESLVGPLNSFRAPGEFGAVVEARATPGGSEIRYYRPREALNAGIATQRGEMFIQVSSIAAPISRELVCQLGIEMMQSLIDFDPPPPPTEAQLAAAPETATEWAIRAGPDVTGLVMPLEAMGYVGRVRVRLDCLVIEEQRVNCAVQSEEPVGMHFGDAALAESRFNRILPVIDGQPTLGRRVQFTVRYDLAGSAPE